MIILTNCLARYDDEGSLKVAANLIEGLKKRLPETMVVTYENESPLADRHLQLNKLMLNASLAGLLRKQKQDLFYVPLYARMLPMALRTLVLSIYTRRRFKLLLPMCPRPSRLANLLIRLSGAEFIVLSKKTFEDLDKLFPGKIHYLRAGVDTRRFVPVPVDKKTELRKKYGLPVDKPIVLHVGHMKYGRNVDKLLSIDEKFHVVLAVSTSTAAFKDANLEEKFRKKSNITLIDHYVSCIEELYQLADVYFFPVLSERNCIDVPLSAFEAAACNLPVLTTPYGELREMTGREGFYPLDSFEPDRLSAAIESAMTGEKNVRQNILAYDWNAAADALLQILQGNPKGRE